MRFTGFVLLAGAALAGMTAPAQAAWHGYISHPLGFNFAAPGELKIEKGTYSGAVAGRHDTLIYRFVDDDIEYKVVVIDVTAQANQAATLLGEAEYLFQDQKKLLVDAIDRFDGHVRPALLRERDLDRRGFSASFMACLSNCRTSLRRFFIPAR